MTTTMIRYYTVYRTYEAAERVRDQIAADDTEWTYRVDALSPTAFVIIPIDETGQEMTAL